MVVISFIANYDSFNLNLFLLKSFNASRLLFKAGDAGLWYRKESPESTKSKKKGKSRDKKLAGKSGQDSEAEPTTQNSETCTKKVSCVGTFYGIN